MFQTYTGKLEQPLLERFIPFLQVILFTILVQVGITGIFILFSMYSQSFFQFQVENIWLLIVAFIVTITTEICIFCCEFGRKHPVDMILTCVFTLAESYIVSFIASVTGQ